MGRKQRTTRPDSSRLFGWAGVAAGLPSQNQPNRMAGSLWSPPLPSPHHHSDAAPPMARRCSSLRTVVASKACARAAPGAARRSCGSPTSSRSRLRRRRPRSPVRGTRPPLRRRGAPRRRRYAPGRLQRHYRAPPPPPGPLCAAPALVVPFAPAPYPPIRPAPRPPLCRSACLCRHERRLLHGHRGWLGGWPEPSPPAQPFPTGRTGPSILHQIKVAPFPTWKLLL